MTENILNAVEGLGRTMALGEVIKQANIAACGVLGGVDTTYYRKKSGGFGFVNHAKGTTVTLQKGLTEISFLNFKEYEAEKEGMMQFVTWYRKEVEKEWCTVFNVKSPYFTSNYQTFFSYHALDKSDPRDGQGGHLLPVRVAEQCVNKYIRLLADDLFFRELHLQLKTIEELENEVRELLLVRKQSESEIMLLMSQPVKKLMADVATIQPATAELELF
jgi:hypothetical protein